MIWLIKIKPIVLLGGLSLMIILTGLILFLCAKDNLIENEQVKG